MSLSTSIVSAMEGYGPRRLGRSVRLQLGSTVLSAAGRLAPGRVSDAILILGTPRSGTTWLLEILHHLEGYKAYSEPLLYREAREVGFPWRPYVAPEEERTDELAFLRSVLRGTGGSPRGWRFRTDGRGAQLLEFVRNRSVVAKFCRAGRLARWMLGHLPVRGAIYLTRHPCAVIASMLKHGAWEGEEDREPSLPERLRAPGTLPADLERRFQSVIASINTWVEYLAATWALDHYVPLHYRAPQSHPWMIVPYERLVVEGRGEIERIVAYLDVDAPGPLIGQLSVPSSTTVDGVCNEAVRQLSKWRRTLTEEQISAILRVTGAFGIEAYSEALEPDYDRLAGFQARSAPSLTRPEPAGSSPTDRRSERRS